MKTIKSTSPLPRAAAGAEPCEQSAYLILKIMKQRGMKQGDVITRAELQKAWDAELLMYGSVEKALNAKPN